MDTRPTSDWTVTTLKEHFDALLAENDRRYQQRAVTQEQAIKDALTAQKEAIAAALAAADRAVAKAEGAAEKRFEGVNEFRGQLADQQRTLMPRQEADAEFRAIRGEMNASISAINDKLSEMAERMNRSEGRSTGLNAGWIYLIGGIGLVGTILGIIGAVSFLAQR